MLILLTSSWPLWFESFNFVAHLTTSVTDSFLPWVIKNCTWGALQFEHGLSFCGKWSWSKWRFTVWKPEGKMCSRVKFSSARWQQSKDFHSLFSNSELYWSKSWYWAGDVTRLCQLYQPQVQEVKISLLMLQAAYSFIWFGIDECSVLWVNKLTPTAVIATKLTVT